MFRSRFLPLITGFTLLACNAESNQTQVLIDAAATAGVPLTVIDEALGAEADRYEAQWVLVRPDQFVAWVSHDLTVNANQALQLFKRLRGSSHHAIS